MVPPASMNGSVSTSTATAPGDGPTRGPVGEKVDLLNALLREYPELTMQVVTDAVDEAWATVESVRTAPAFWLTYVDLLAREELSRERLIRRAPRPALVVPAAPPA